MKTNLKLLGVFLLASGFSAHAQVVPEATGPTSAVAAAERLDYAVRYSETGQFSTSLSDWQTSTVSGSLAYGNKNVRYPFSMDYSGGYTWTLTGPDYTSGQFHHLYLSQGFVFRKSKFILSDDVSYLPQSPETGFSGVPGTGEPIGGTGPTPPSTTQSILTLDTHAINQTASGVLEETVNPHTSFKVGGGYGLLRFPDNDGFNTDGLTANAQLIQRLNARNALTGAYQFAHFTYVGSTDSFETNTVMFGVRREWTRNLTTDFAGGPEWISGAGTTPVPSSTNIAAAATINYQLRFASANVSYQRGVNGGAGYLVGGQFDQLEGGLSKDVSVNLSLGVSGGYERTASLDSGGVTDGTFGGVEATWHLGRNLILFANYTGTNQTSTLALPSTALNQVLQVIGFGVGFSPRESRHSNQ